MIQTLLNRLLFPPCFVAIVLLCFSAGSSKAQGYLVPNGIVTNLFPGEIDLVWPAVTQVNGFQFSPVGKTSASLTYINVFEFSEPVTIGVRVFFISANQSFTLDTIRAGTYSEVSNPINPATPSNPTNVFNVNVPFYVALYSGAQFAAYYPSGNTSPIEYTDPVFGWARLVNREGTIQLVSGALAYGAAGIYAGTQTIIATPEPCSMALVGLGTALLGFQRCRKSSSSP